MIKGTTIILIEKEFEGTDGFGEPICKEVPVKVDDVLIGEPSSEDITNQLNLTGKKAIYTLAIPKGDTHEWEDAEVEFFGRRWHVFTIPIEGIEENIPLRWNKKVMVEAYE